MSDDWGESLMDMATSGLNSFINIAADGYGRKSKQGLGSYLLTKGIDMAKYGLYQSGLFGPETQDKYAGKSVLDLAGGFNISYDFFDRKAKNADPNANVYQYSLGISIGGSGMQITEGPGDISWDTVFSAFHQPQESQSAPREHEDPLEALVNNSQAILNDEQQNMLDDMLKTHPDLTKEELLHLAQDFVTGAAGANAEKNMEQLQSMNPDIMKLAKALNYFDQSVSGEKGTAQIAEMLKQQMANKINDIMQNGYQSPTEKDRDGNPKVYTGQEAIDKFMEFAQAELAEKAKDAQMASWKNYDAAEAAKQQAAMQQYAAGVMGNIKNVFANMGGSSGSGLAGGGGSSYGTNPMQYMNLLAYNPSMHQGVNSPGGMNSQIFIDYINGKPLPASYQGPSLVAGSGYQMTEAEKIAKVKSEYMFNPAGAQKLAEYYGLNTLEYLTFDGAGSGILVGSELNDQTPQQVGQTAGTLGMGFSTAGYIATVCGFPEIGIPLMAIGTGFDLMSAASYTVNYAEDLSSENLNSLTFSAIQVALDVAPLVLEAIHGASPNYVKPQLVYDTPQLQEAAFYQNIVPLAGVAWGWTSTLIPNIRSLENTNVNNNNYRYQRYYFDASRY